MFHYNSNPMEARPCVDARRESSDHMRRFIWSAPDHNEKWSDLDDRYRRKLCHPGNWKVTEMWLKNDCIVTEVWLNFDWNVSERYWNGTTSVTFPELSINIPLQNSTVKSFILWTILFRYFISFDVLLSAEGGWRLMPIYCFFIVQVVI